ncbi:MAG: thermonuclease family protein [Myxococcota bacterium]
MLCRFATVSVLATALALGSCGTTQSARRYKKSEAAAVLKRLEVVGLELGVFPFDGAAAVIDGDTVRVKGLDNSLRLLAIDTEETFKQDWEKKAFAGGWESYKKQMRGDSPRPVKMATPLGEEAKKWAEAFFEGVKEVKLERDHPGEIRDYFGRYLVYILVEKNGRWLNYNLEAVHAGMSPYFTKYGRSRRFHRELVEAQRAAREAGLGIWDPRRQHYDDYPERLAWWDARGDMVARFEKEMETQDDHIALTRWDSMLKLEQFLGKQVTLLGAVNDIRMADGGPTVVKLGRSRGNDFDVVFWDKDVALASGVLSAQGEYVKVRGIVNKYRDEYRNVERLQVVVALPGQVVFPSAELEKLLADDEAKTPVDDD